MASPFLKWAGGKGRLVPVIAARIPASFGRYHEPFLGGGAVFFGLECEGSLRSVSLNDANAELIAVFTAVRDSVEDLAAALGSMSQTYLALATDERATYYYAVRRCIPADPIAAAARLLFLNRTCYNGLYRVNRSGLFNVPHGRYVRPVIINEPNLRVASRALAGTDLTSMDFEAACDRAEAGDLVYLDPPYHPLSATSRFTSYTSGDFGWPEQERLARVYADLTRRGVYAILSNSAHDDIAPLYTGFTVEEVPMSRAINSKPGGRKAVAEFLISNVAAIRGA